MQKQKQMQKWMQNKQKQKQTESHVPYTYRIALIPTVPSTER
jgi:hypothetical protein